LKTNELHKKIARSNWDLESEGNGLKRGRAPGLPGELSVEGGKLPGFPSAGQMQRAAEVKTFLEPVQGFGYRNFTPR
jgi:hypothetical protein